MALLVAAVARGLVRSAHDVSDGGLAVALAECSFAGPVPIGAEVALGDTIRPDALLFGEATGRGVVGTAEPEVLLALARDGAVPARSIGATGGARLLIGPPRGEPWIDALVARLREIWARALPRRMEVA